MTPPNVADDDVDVDEGNNDYFNTFFLLMVCTCILELFVIYGNKCIYLNINEKNKKKIVTNKKPKNRQKILTN